MARQRKHKIRLVIGKFYRVLDGSPGGHPGQIYDINQNEKSFYAVVTGSMTFEEFKKLGLRKGYIRLNYSTDDKVDISLIKKDHSRETEMIMEIKNIQTCRSKKLTWKLFFGFKERIQSMVSITNVK